MNRILIIDDTPDHRSLFGTALRLHGFEVAEADGGESGLTQYKNAINEEAPFDLIVMDLGMPFMNGYEVAEKIRFSGDTQTPILFLTAHLTGKTDRMEELKPCLFMAKPIRSTDLISAVERSSTVVGCEGGEAPKRRSTD